MKGWETSVHYYYERTKISRKSRKDFRDVCPSFLGMGLQPCLASHSYNAASAGVVQVEQQKQKITGCVLDVTGSPLPGASVLVKGAPGRGAITDMDGNFSVEAEQGEQLEISFIGMETQVVTVSAKTRLQITLKEDSKTLDEVVVVGYGTQKKANLTGASSQCFGRDIGESPDHQS